LPPALASTLTRPDGQRIGFTATHQVISVFFGVIVQVSFTPDPGVYDKLDPVGGNVCYLVGGLYAADQVGFSPFAPAQYRLTTKDGTLYDYDITAGLQKITDRNGNTVTFTANAITHSSGQTISLARDGQNRITSITDPAGNPVTYAYDAKGDLVSFTDGVGQRTIFTYKAVPPHYLGAVIDPLGRTGARTEYDAMDGLLR